MRWVWRELWSFEVDQSKPPELPANLIAFHRDHICLYFFTEECWRAVYYLHWCGIGHRGEASLAVLANIVTVRVWGGSKITGRDDDLERLAEPPLGPQFNQLNKTQYVLCYIRISEDPWLCAAYTSDIPGACEGELWWTAQLIEGIGHRLKQRTTAAHVTWNILLLPCTTILHRKLNQPVRSVLLQWVPGGISRDSRPVIFPRVRFPPTWKPSITVATEGSNSWADSSLSETSGSRSDVLPDPPAREKTVYGT